MRARMAQFMAGRYGRDDLGQFLTVVCTALLLVSLFTGWTVLYSVALVMLVFSTWRMFSRNLEKRRDENLAFLRLKGRFMGFFTRGKNRAAQSKTHRFYKCPSCKQQLRVPKGKGRISVHCPKCGTSFEKKT